METRSDSAADIPSGAPCRCSGLNAVDVIIADVEDSEGATGLGFSYCIAVHAKKAVELGVSRAEIAEALGTAIALNAETALTYTARVFEHDRCAPIHLRPEILRAAWGGMSPFIPSH